MEKIPHGHLVFTDIASNTLQKWSTRLGANELVIVDTGNSLRIT